LKRYALLTVGMMALFLALFGVVSWLEIPLLTDPAPWLEAGGLPAAVVGVGLLVGDVFLPVPSSLVMILHGVLFGIVLGTALSLVGSVGATLFGFWLGRRGGPLLERLVSAPERHRADRLLERYGDLAILVTRPVPVLAETVAILAGTSTASALGWGRVTLAAVAGSLPAALLYALTGATAARLDQAGLVFVLVLAMAGGFWWLGRHMETVDQKDA
jgi:uncharacterized membrane protein YdjX (TVP38/TMEM64 family)